MLINIVDVGSPNTHAAKNGRSYQSIEVTYKGENGQVGNKKLMSFSNPAVFNHIKNLQKGSSVNVTTVKDANGYWQWTGIEGEGAASAEAKPTGGTVGTTNRVTGSNYETKEERAARQILIVRQSSLSSAVELLGPGKTVEEVLKVARQFEDYVFAKDSIPEVTQDEDDTLV